MKIRLLLLTIITAVFTLAFSTEHTGAFFIDKNETVGAKTSAGHLEVSVNTDFSGYGVPGGIMKLGQVEITNMGGIDIDYKLQLFADSVTANLLDEEKGAIMLYQSGKLLVGDLLIGDNGEIRLLYSGELKTGEPLQKFDVELAFKGVELTDGNDYQNKAIVITHEINAYQSESAAGGGL